MAKTKRSKPAQFSDAPAPVAGVRLPVAHEGTRAQCAELEREVERLRRANRALEERAARFASFPLLNPDPVLEVSATGELTFCNGAGRRVLEELGLDPADPGPFLPPNLQEIFDGHGGPEAPATYREFTLGERVFAQTTCFEEPFHTARIYTHEVTARRQAERALAESEATLRGIVNATQESIWLFDRNGVALLGNETALARLGQPASELIGKNLAEIVPQPLADARMARLREVTTGGKWVQFEDERAGMHFEHSFYPVFDGEGRVVRVACFSRDVTERKRADVALQRHAEAAETARAMAERDKRLLEAVMAALPVGICITDAAGGILRTNAAFEQIWTGPRPPAISVDHYNAYRAWWAETQTPLAPEEWASAQAVQKGVSVVGQLLEIQRFDGSRAFVLNSAAPVRDVAGRVVGSATAIQDITALRQAEAALRAREEQFRRLFEGHGAIMLLIEPESGAIVDANFAAAAFYGHTRDELRRMAIQDINRLPPAEVAAERRRAVEEKRNYFVFPHRLADGSVRWVEVYSTPVEVRSTHLLFSVIHDITDRRRAEDALVESEQRLRFHMENSPLAVVEWDAHFVVTRWAGEAERLFGWTEAEVVGKPIAELCLVAEEDVPYVEEVMAQLTDGVTHRVMSANRNVTKGGEVLVCEWYNSVLHGADGQMSSVLSLVLDVTERERHERALRDAREAAEAASRAKSEFLAVMSHEIRTPMNGILGMAELLAGSPLDARQREYVWGIRTSGRLLSGVINDILDFSKIEAGGLELDAAPFDLAVAVEETVHLVADAAAQKEVELACLIGSDAPAQVRGDQTRVQQVLLNLLGNAVKFTEAGEVAVRATVLRRAADHVLIRITVTDTGVGIPEQAQSRLFQPFSQAEAATTRQYGGTGLGLAICRRLVEAMGGQIGFESREGAGSTFWFTVPFRGATAPRKLPSFGGHRALVAAVGETSRAFLREQLGRLGIETEAADDAALAAALLARAGARGAPFSLAFVDAHLPGLGSSPVASWFPSAPDAPAPSVVRLTSLSSEEPTANGMPHLLKPVRESRLPYCIRAALGEAPSRTQQPPATPPAPARVGRVLLAEDNRINQAVAIGMLEQLGFSVALVEDGAAAVEAAFAEHYDAVLLDWRMPVLDGLEAAREIRRREAGGARRYLVGVTAHASTADRQRCLEAGLDEHLPKPLTLEALAAALAKTRAHAADVGGATGDGLGSFEARIQTLAKSLPLDRITAILESFLRDAGLKVEQLQDAVRSQDHAARSALAHGLRGATCVFGTDRMIELARNLEDLSPGATALIADTLVGEIREELERITRFVRSGGVARLGPR